MVPVKALYEIIANIMNDIVPKTHNEKYSLKMQGNRIKGIAFFKLELRFYCQHFYTYTMFEFRVHVASMR